ncbi:AAA domain-containing protein, partial [Pyxidicoccus sp. 3LG]
AVARGQRLLCTAASNAAVDHLLDLCLDKGLRAIRVGHPARVAPRLQEHTLDIVVEDHPDRAVSRDLFDEAWSLMGYARRQRTQGRSRERFANARASTTEAKSMLDEARALEKKAVRAVLARADVVCVTLASLDSGVLSNEKFDLALLDEATQATEPLALLGFLRAPKVVLAGDPQQLPPTVLSQEAAKAGLGVSLFERLLKDHGEGVKRMLREQYRMNARIMDFPSREMYAGELRAHPSVADRTLREVLTPGAQASELDAPPVLFLDTAGKGFEEEVEPTTKSLFNAGEADLVEARVRALLAAGLSPRELAVITPYSAQAHRLRERVEALHPEVEVDTVDAFQGREKDAILVSLTRSNGEGQLGFLNDLRRINVAITRARRHLFVVGDSATLSGHPFYARFIEGTQATGGYRSAWEWPDAT